MAIATDIQGLLEKLDLQILALLEERMHAAQEFSSTDGAEALLEAEAESVGLWLEEAADRGLDEATIEKICRLVQLLSKKTEE